MKETNSLENIVLLESAKTINRVTNKHDLLLFTNPVEIISTHSLTEVNDTLYQIDEAINRGFWVAGYISYEAGFAFETKLNKLPFCTTLPLIRFGVYEAPQQRFNFHDKNPNENLINDEGVEHLELNFDFEYFNHAIEQIKEYIRSGDVYQINLTGKLSFSFRFSPLSLFYHLKKKQPVDFAAFLHFDNTSILSFSPELFFRVEDGMIELKPMKGTAKRGKTASEDDAISFWLTNDEKNRAENLMIVDLIRNDIGRLCKTGSVCVPKLFETEKFQTLWQLTSTVRGELNPDFRFSEIFQSIFPCGSITGAPKIRAMEIINELETNSRGIYTGSIGYISPKKKACFNVAIRTLELCHSSGKMGIGSGITIDSDGLSEYEETLLKSSFLSKPSHQSNHDFSLIESIKFNNYYQFLENHLYRLKESARYFDIPIDHQSIMHSLMEYGQRLQQNRIYKVRLLVSKNGDITLQHYPITPISSLIAVSPKRTNSSNPFFYHKTTNRNLYNQATIEAKAKGYADIIFLNERDELSEGAVSNVFLEQSGYFFTPPLSAGILPGVYREHVLSTTNAKEKTLYLSDLMNADKIYICNSIRGLHEVSLVQSPILH